MIHHLIALVSSLYPHRAPCVKPECALGRQWRGRSTAWTGVHQGPRARVCLGAGLHSAATPYCGFFPAHHTRNLASISATESSVFICSANVFGSNHVPDSTCQHAPCWRPYLHWTGALAPILQAPYSLPPSGPSCPFGEQSSPLWWHSFGHSLFQSTGQARNPAPTTTTVKVFEAPCIEPYLMPLFLWPWIVP